MLLTRMGPGSFALLPTGLASEALGSYLICIPYTFPTLPNMKSGVGKGGGDGRAVEATGHLAFLLWSSHYWEMNLLHSSPWSDFVILLGAASPRAFCSGNLMPRVCSI